MSQKMLAGLAAAWLFFGSSVLADDATFDEQMKAVRTLIQDNVNAQKTNESDYAKAIDTLDQMISSQDPTATNNIAGALFLKGQIYDVALGDVEKCAPIYRRIATQYPTFVLAEDASQRANFYERKMVAKHIRDTLTPGTVFPDFTEQDTQGHSLSVSNYPGKVVLVDFWATWCPNCMIEMPSVIKFYKAHHKQGLEIVGICANRAEEANDLQIYLKKNPDMTWPQYYDGLYWNNKLVLKYGVEEAPWNIIIGRDGKIIAVNVHNEDLEKVLTKALAQK